MLDEQKRREAFEKRDERIRLFKENLVSDCSSFHGPQPPALQPADPPKNVFMHEFGRKFGTPLLNFELTIFQTCDRSIGWGLARAPINPTPPCLAATPTLCNARV